MALIDLARQETKRPGVRCAFGQWFDTQDAEMQTEVRDLFAAADVPTSAAARLLSKVSGQAVNDERIRRHRCGECVDCVRSGRLT